MNLYSELQKISQEVGWNDQINEQFVSLYKQNKIEDLSNFYDYNVTVILELINDIHGISNTLKDILLLVGYIGLTKALNFYSLDHNYTFRVYEKRFIYNQMLFYLRRYERIVNRQYIPQEKTPQIHIKSTEDEIQSIKNCIDAFAEEDFAFLEVIYSDLSQKQQFLLRKYYGLDQLQVNKTKIII